VVLLGTLVPLPDAQITNANFVPNGTNTTFTVNTAGLYRVSYSINLTAGALLGTRILLNGTAVTQSEIAPILTLEDFTNEFLINLSAGDTLSLEMFGLAGVAILQTGAGAELMVIRLS
jgi:hypothetical protein